MHMPLVLSSTYYTFASAVRRTDCLEEASPLHVLFDSVLRISGPTQGFCRKQQIVHRRGLRHYIYDATRKIGGPGPHVTEPRAWAIERFPWSPHTRRLNPWVHVLDLCLVHSS